MFLEGREKRIALRRWVRNTTAGAADEKVDGLDVLCEQMLRIPSVRTPD
jgi:hypothetical protein